MGQFGDLCAITTLAAELSGARAKPSHGGLRWALIAIVCQHLTVVRIAEALTVSWNCANDAVLAEGRRVLIAGPNRLGGVSSIGVHEHVWRHTRHGDKYVTVIVDLTPIRCGTGPARLLDMVEGRSKDVFAAWLVARPQDRRDAAEVVAMDGFTGFKNAAAQELPEAVTVMDPFHHKSGSSASPAKPSTRPSTTSAGVGSRNCTVTLPDSEAARTTRCIALAGFCTPARTY